jgi:hypothetical protein
VTPAARRYREIVIRVMAMREVHGGVDPLQEDPLLEEADDLWWEMTDEEREEENRLAEEAIR